MNLSTENLRVIQQAIEESPITRTSMKENIIDHLSCSIEFKMAHGWSFEEAFGDVVHEFAPNGLAEIEYEAHVLLNIKTITMKKFTYVSGLIFSVTASVGFLLNMFHFSVGKDMLILGFGGMGILFAPMLLMIRKREKTPFERRRDNVALISLILLSIGGMLKTFHVVTANETLIIGTAVFAFGFLPMTFLKMYRESIAG